MKFTHIIFALSCLFIISCASNKPLSLKMALPQGDKFNYSMATNTVANVSVMGMDQKTTSMQKLDYVYEVLSSTTNGDQKIKSTIRSVEVDQINPMQTMHYSSRETTGNSPELADVYEPILGHEMIMNFNNKGEMVKFEKGGDLVSKMFEGKDDEAMAQMKSLIEGQFGEEAMAAQLSNITSIYPDKPVKVGDTWMKENVTTGAIALIIKTTYTLTSRKNGKAMISLKGTVTPSPDSEALEMMGMKMTYQLGGPLTGNMIVDEKTGWVDESNVDQELEGKVNISGEMIGSMDTDMSMSSSTMTKRTSL